MSDNTRLSDNMPTDRTKYYDASRFGMGRGTIIPAGEPGEFDGRSKGLDHNRPLKVIVDPDQPGAFELDVANLNDKLIKKAMVDPNLDTSERLRAIKSELETARQPEPQQPASPKLSFTSESVFAPKVTMQSNDYTTGNFKIAQQHAPQSANSLSAASATPSSYITATQYPPQFRVGPTYSNYSTIGPVEPTPTELALHKQVSDLNSHYDQLGKAYNEKIAEYTELVDNYEMLRANYTELGDAYERAINELKELRAEALKPDISALPDDQSYLTDVLPFIGSKPRPPKSKIIFNFKQIGIMSAFYHKLIVTEHNVILIYDTRFEYGTQYIPPQLSGDQSVEITIIDEDGTQNAVIQSLGVNYSVGCLDMSVLFKV